MSNGDRFLSLDEFDEAFCAGYTGFAPPAPAQEQMPQPYMPQPQFQPQQTPQPYPSQEYRAYPSESPQFYSAPGQFPASGERQASGAYPGIQTFDDDPFLMAAQSLPEMEAAPQYPLFRPQNAPPFAPAPPAPQQQQWPPAGGYQAAPEQQVAYPAAEPEEFVPPPQKDKKRLTKQLVMIGITAFLVILVTAGVLVSKRVFGIEILSMNTAEMGQKLPLGTLVIIKKAEYKDLEVKHVVAYEFEKGKPIIRRITRLHPETKSFSVKGDAAATSVTVSNDRMRGRVRWTVKYLGYPLYLLRSTVAKIAAAVVVVLLWAAIFYLISGYGKPKKPENGPENDMEIPPPTEQPMPQQMPQPNPYYTA